MRLYVAGAYHSRVVPDSPLYLRMCPESQRKVREEVPFYLESYHYLNSQSKVARIRDLGGKVFLDSGAFSAFTQGVSIDVDRYCGFIKDNADIIETVDGQPVASVLDAIGDCDGTWRNQMEMERLGVRPLPCFHYGEPVEALDWYIQNYSFITIGGMVPISNTQLVTWLDRIWANHLTNEDGTPKVKVHGFGFTSLQLMLRYPWFSVDSSSWVQQAANGSILLPHRGMNIAVSEHSPMRKQRGMHIDSVTPIERESIEKELIEKDHTDPKDLRTLYLTRWAHNVYAFPKFVSLRGGATHFHHVEQELF